jgi:hypothetical protein
MKRALSPGDEDGEEKSGGSEGSAREEAPAPCCPPQGSKVSKQEKLRVKRRRRKERMKAAQYGNRWEEHSPDSPHLDFFPDAYLDMRFGM